MLKTLEDSEIYKILLDHNPSECGPGYPGYKFSSEDETHLVSMNAAFLETIKDICNTYEDYEACARRAESTIDANNSVALGDIKLFRDRNTDLYNARMNTLTIRYADAKKIILDRGTVN
jgi:hypothetical protein